MNDKKTGVILLLVQISIIVCFVFLTSYSNGEYQGMYSYPMFQDIQCMILLGFGALMTFLKKYGYSSTGLTFYISTITFQYGIICQRIIGPIYIGLNTLINAEVLTASILIAFGAVIGKTNPLQLLVMILIQGPMYIGNLILSQELKVADIGGSVSIHCFGAYFGLALSKVLGEPKNVSNEGSSYNSDIFSIIGTLVLWVFWPSFNAIGASGNGQERAIINTFLSLSSSCLITFAFSSLTDKNNKFTMSHIQNATLAGGVAIGAVANLIIQPWAALLIGTIAGTTCTFGILYLQPWLTAKIGLHDTCGINNLHGMPSVIAGLAGAIFSAQASIELYGDELYTIYPAMAPEAFSKEYMELKTIFPHLIPGDNRTALKQALYQLLDLILTYVIALTGGALTGLLIKMLEKILGIVPDEHILDDNFLWNVPEDEQHKRESTSTTIPA